MKNAVKLLLVDDDANTRALYVESLRAVNFDVREGSDGLEGLKIANEFIPDIIVTGIIMPKMDGFSFANELKKNVATASISVVFLSHLGREEDKARAMSMGAKDFLIRDMTSPNDMIERLNTILTSKEYVLGIDPFNFDAAKFARDFNLNPDFVCSEKKAGGRVALKLRKRSAGAEFFEAEIICV